MRRGCAAVTTLHRDAGEACALRRESGVIAGDRWMIVCSSDAAPETWLGRRVETEASLHPCQRRSWAVDQREAIGATSIFPLGSLLAVCSSSSTDYSSSFEASTRWSNAR